MKSNIIYNTLIAGLLFLPAYSCTQKEEAPTDDSFALILKPSVSSPATKAEVASDQSLKEDAVDLLNVYFYGTFRGDASPKVKHYLLNAATDKTGTTAWRVSSDWRSEGFVAGNSYDVYVSANSQKVKMAATSSDGTATGVLADASITDLAGLKSMIEFDYNPAEENGEGGHKPYWGAYDEDNLNPEWLDLHKKYISNSTFDVATGNTQQKRFYTNDKTFLMDGKATFTAGSTEAIPLELVRAAAKVVVDVKFSDTFLTSLAAKNVTVTGAPAWRFYNFSFSTPVFDPAQIAGAAVNYNKSIFVAGGIMMSNGSVDSELVYTGSDKHFSFTTYTYPFGWTSGSASSEAPAIILSLGYTDSTDPLNPTTAYQTYKIPVVDPESGVTEMGRNKLYYIKATIASEGGELLTDAYKVRCNYDIIPWGNIPVDSEDIADVDHSDNDYFDVSPTSVTLHGDGVQTEDITIIKPNKRNFEMQYLTLPSATAEHPFDITTIPVKTEYSFTNDIAENARAPYFFNYLGEKRTALVTEQYVGTVVAGTTEYLQNKFIRSEGTLTIESCSLPNFADKYMMIRVHLDVDGWEAKGLYKDITIRHLATTRISHKTGAWSSRISACGALSSTDPNYEAFTAADGPYGPEEYRYMSGTVYSYDRATYNSWETPKNEVGWETCTEAQYNEGKAGSFPDDYKYEDTSGSPSSYTYKNEETYSAYFHNDGTEIDTNKKATHTGESNAYLQDGWYYWGVGATQVFQKAVTGANNGTGYTNTESNYYSSSLDEIYAEGYDYYTFSGVRTSSGLWNYTNTGTFTFFRYTTRYRANNYILRTWSRKKFSHTDYAYILNPDHVPSSAQSFRNYRWVNYATDLTGTHNFRLNTDGYTTNSRGFRPKYYNGTSVYYMSSSNTTYGNTVTQGSEISTFNPRIFIVQSSSPSSSYVMGRPNMDDNGLSQDRVFSPAFMIASQLGAISAIPGTGAYNASTHGITVVVSETEKQLWSAKHCATYLEVGTDGTYYKNWRLPTQEEIGIIIGLQSTSPDGDTSLNQVLNAGYYRSLDGTEVATGSGLTTHAVRCVRDLTQAEIDALNE